MSQLSLIEQICTLGLPTDEFIVIGSRVMEVLGLRTSGDIDLVVSERVFEYLRESGWREELKHGQVRLVQGDTEAWLTWSYNGKDLYLADLQAQAIQVQGLAFVSPTFLLRWKQEKARPKDVADIALLQGYLTHG